MRVGRILSLSILQGIFMATKSSPPIYIFGAGPAGLAAAYQLTKQGQSVVVVERDSRVGGLAKSIEYQDFILDYGPHRFFTKVAPVLKLWNEVFNFATEPTSVREVALKVCVKKSKI